MAGEHCGDVCPIDALDTSSTLERSEINQQTCLPTNIAVSKWGMLELLLHELLSHHHRERLQELP
jgi:hypothetical protein